jgi:hypothetical protein
LLICRSCSLSLLVLLILLEIPSCTTLLLLPFINLPLEMLGEVAFFSNLCLRLLFLWFKIGYLRLKCNTLKLFLLPLSFTSRLLFLPSLLYFLGLSVEFLKSGSWLSVIFGLQPLFNHLDCALGELRFKFELWLLSGLIFLSCLLLFLFPFVVSLKEHLNTLFTLHAFL